MAPAEAVLEAAGLHARHIEVARQLVKAVPGASELAGIQKSGGGGTARRGGRERRQRVKEWGQAKPRRLGGAPIGGASGRWAGKPAAAAPA
jgi:hypothetical protein